MPRAEFLRAPYCCLSIPVSEVMSWRLEHCYIKTQYSSNILSLAIVKIDWNPAGFGYHDVSWQRVKTYGFFTTFCLRSRDPREPDFIVTCGARSGYSFLDARPAKPTKPEEVAEQEGGAEADIERLSSFDSYGQQVCWYWHEQAVAGRLNWKKTRKVPGPVLEAEFDINGRTLLLLLVLQEASIESKIGNMAMDRYTLWLAWRVTPAGKA